MKLEELKKVVKKNNLIETISDIEFLFLDYSIKDKTQPISDLIDDSVTWSYENDDLMDFYLEHLDFLIESGSISPVIECVMKYQTSLGTISKYFDLYCLESKNLQYFKVVGEEELSDVWDTTYGFYEIVNKKSKKTDIISEFKNECHEVFSNFGEFSDDELSSDGNTIKFIT